MKKGNISGSQALEKFIALCLEDDVGDILDIGAGRYESHANVIRKQGLNVETVDFFPVNTYRGDYNSIEFNKKFDGIWCSHVLEHQLNVGIFLNKIRKDVNSGGVVAITVPPWKNMIVGGHVTLWNAGLLLYNMVVAGFDCSHAMVKTYGYNISVIVRKKEYKQPKLTYDTADLKKLLKPYFPMKYYGRGFDGRIRELNWND
jgi:hypothetical protein